MTPWSVVTRSSLGFAALGAGLIHLALAIGAEVGLAVGLGVVGAVEILWGVLAVSRPGLPAPRITLAGALVPPIAWVLVLATSVSGPRLLPMLAATLLDLAIAVGIAMGLRRPTGRESRRPAIGIAVAALLVTLISVPALLATGAIDHLPVPTPPHVGH
ncbi:MAG: hypothetical protein ABIR17_08010 [Pseudolysinimonas sp.]|uniref:hypothetical protein n=1 Tax=Pseudolysinimonas sp. TaxID=2680009 RepID=UPI0032645829